MNKSSYSLQRLCGMALLSALSFLALLVLRLPLFPTASFLDYECKDVLFACAALLYGPAGASTVAFITCLIEWFTVSTTGWIGFVMNLLSSLSFILPLAFLYQKKRTVWRALCGLICGALLSCAVMLLWNAFLTPLYMGVPRQAVLNMLLPIFLPFNLIKGCLNAGLTFFVWNALSPLMQKAGLMPPVHTPSRAATVKTLVLAALLLCGCAITVWLLK